MYFRRYDLGGKDSTDATAFAYAEKKHHITNGDRLRSMSDEEQASKLASFRCPFDSCFPEGGENCKKCWLDWLRQEEQP